MKRYGVFKLGVRDHVMIAHSFRGELFGPAQRVHGATYVIDAVFRAEQLDPNGVLVDIGRASAALHEALADLAYQNLDELPEFRGKNTTTEFLAKLIFDRLAVRVKRGELGSGSEGVLGIEVVLHESHVAFASYDGVIER